ARPAPRPTPFPYTTLFRSVDETARAVRGGDVGGEGNGVVPDTARGGRDRVGVAAAHRHVDALVGERGGGRVAEPATGGGDRGARSEEHTSELQSRFDLVCR